MKRRSPKPACECLTAVRRKLVDDAAGLVRWRSQEVASLQKAEVTATLGGISVSDPRLSLSAPFGLNQRGKLGGGKGGAFASCHARGLLDDLARITSPTVGQIVALLVEVEARLQTLHAFRLREVTHQPPHEIEGNARDTSAIGHVGHSNVFGHTGHPQSCCEGQSVARVAESVERGSIATCGIAAALARLVATPALANPRTGPVA